MSDSRGVFRTMSNLFDEAYFRKQSTLKVKMFEKFVNVSLALHVLKSKTYFSRRNKVFFFFEKENLFRVHLCEVSVKLKSYNSDLVLAKTWCWFTGTSRFCPNHGGSKSNLSLSLFCQNFITVNGLSGSVNATRKKDSCNNDAISLLIK